MSKMIFEIFNKDDKVLRRGYVDKGSLNIDIQSEDYRYVICDETDKSIVYKQGYLQKAPSRAEVNPYPVSITRLDHGKVELFCNTLKDGHAFLCYQKTNDPSTKQEVQLEGPRIQLDIEPGKYLFYTRNDIETSVVIEFTIVNESRVELLEQAKYNIAQYSKQHEIVLSGIQGYLEEDESLGVYQAAQRVYLETPKEQNELLIAAYDFLFHIETILNSRKQLNNEQAITTSRLDTIPQEFVQVGPEITKVLVYEVKGDRNLFVYGMDTESNKAHVVSLRKDCPHRLELYAGNNLVSCFDVFCPDSLIKASMWAIIKEAIDKTEEAEERRNLLFNNRTDISDEDKKMMSIEAFKKPFYETVSAPEVIYLDDDIEVYIQEFEMLRHLDKPLYLSVQEAGSALYPNKSKRYLIADSIVKLNAVKDGLYSNTPYFLWIEDEEHNILSSMRLITSDEEEMYNYDVVSRLTSIKAYQERLIAYVSRHYDGAPKLLKEEIDQISTIADVSPNVFHKSLIAKLSKNKDTRLFNAIANLILQDRYSNVTVNERFFGGNVVLDRKAGTLTFPERFFGYVVQIDSFSVGDQEMKTRNQSIENTGTISLGSDDYFIVSAIDKSNYSRSGFLLLNTFKIDTILASWKLGIEVR